MISVILIIPLVLLFTIISHIICDFFLILIKDVDLFLKNKFTQEKGSLKKQHSYSDIFNQVFKLIYYYSFLLLSIIVRSSLYAFIKIWLYSYTFNPLKLIYEHILHKSHNVFLRKDSEFVAFEKPQDIVNEKIIVFIRHGESIWNMAFNHPSYFLLPVRIIMILIMELYNFCTSDSILLDSPLSPLGRIQSNSLAQWFSTELNRIDKLLNNSNKQSDNLLVNGNIPTEDSLLNKSITLKEYRDIIQNVTDYVDYRSSDVVVLTSNLRRSIETAEIILTNITPNYLARKGNDNPTICVLPCLQEISPNIDSYSINVLKNKIESIKYLPNFLKKYLQIVSNTKLHLNEIHIKDTIHFPNNDKILSKLCSFSSWVTSNTYEIAGKQAVIIVGHSIWIKFFFQTFLPKRSSNTNFFKKIGNCGVVLFKLSKYKLTNSTVDYCIDPDSISFVYPR